MQVVSGRLEACEAFQVPSTSLPHHPAHLSETCHLRICICSTVRGGGGQVGLAGLTSKLSKAVQLWPSGHGRP